MIIDKVLLSELRLLESKESGKGLVKGDLDKAILDNENLRALGYELTFDSLVLLAKDYKTNPQMTPLYKRVMELEPGIEVSPMYPNFPQQVLEMEEVEYRYHQALHYLSTYGMELISNIEVQEGWRPYDKDTFIEREEDKNLINLKLLEYLTPDGIDASVIKKLANKKERLNEREVKILKRTSLRTKTPISEVPFKENIGLVYGEWLLEDNEPEQTKAIFDILEPLMKHPGDVLDLIEYMVVKNKYKHFRTGVKRGLVKLIENFSQTEIEENLSSNRWSSTFKGKKGKKRSRNKSVSLIDYLSFNRFATTEDAKQAVRNLKDGKLISWNQNLELAYKEDNKKEVLSLLSQRPGILFRHVNRLFKLGYDMDKVKSMLTKNASTLKTQSIVSALNNYDGERQVQLLFVEVLLANLESKVISSLQGKKVFIEETDVDFSRSKIAITDKNDGYITSGIALKVPEEVKLLRFFTYWNDVRRIDIDLHSVANYKSGGYQHIGWSGRYKSDCIVSSGDLTGSDSAEYIDVDLDRAYEEDGISHITFDIESFTGVKFKDIETVFTGLMAVSEAKEKVQLYDSKNVIFRHDLDQNAVSLNYGVLDLENRVIFINGAKSAGRLSFGESPKPQVPPLSMLHYIVLLILSQKGSIVQDKTKADLVIGLTKSDEDNYISLIDENFFMD